MIRLRGMTWDHSRGVDPLVACSARFEREMDTAVDWDARSLEDFETFPLDELAAKYDLLVIDHPHVGVAAASGCLRPFDNQLSDSLRGSTVGRSHESYHWQGRQWALAIDAAAQVSARRAGSDVEWPRAFDDLLMLAQTGRVLWPLSPVHALMSFYTLTAGAGAACATSGPELIVDRAAALNVLARMVHLAEAVPRECFDLNPIDVLERMVIDHRFDYCPLIYGYVNYALIRSGRTRIEFADLFDGARGSAIGGTGIAVSAHSPHADSAARFAAWVASPDVQRSTYARAGGQPAHRAAWVDPEVNAQTGDFYINTMRTLDAGYLRPRFDGYIRFQTASGVLLQQCLRGERSGGQTIDDLNRAFKEAQR